MTPRENFICNARDYSKAAQLSGTYGVHKGVANTSWIETKKSLSAPSQVGLDDDGAISALTRDPLDRRDGGSEPVKLNAELARIEPSEEDSDGQPDCDAIQDETDSDPHSIQVLGVVHTDPEGLTIHLLPVNPDAESIVYNAITFLTETWRTELIPPVYRMKLNATYTQSDMEDVDEATPNSRAISSGCIIPLARFAEEILARSRTTLVILEFAMEYLKALQPQLSDLQASCSNNMSIPDLSYSESPTENPDDRSAILASLPSPILCPRRMFLAALMLAWKFVEDIFIPNGDWASIAGLPLWEASRCERVLGNTLDWKLWVCRRDAERDVE